MANLDTDLQRAQLRLKMGMSKLFASSNAIFEGVLNTIEGTIDDGSTFNLTIEILNNTLIIDNQILANSKLMLATEIPGEVKFDAIRNDAALRKIGRAYISQLSTIFSMKPAKDFYSPSDLDSSGDIHLYGFGQ